MADQKRIAVVKDGMVINTHVLDVDTVIAEKVWQIPEGCTVVESDVADPGDAYVAGEFVKPETPTEE